MAHIDGAADHTIRDEDGYQPPGACPDDRLEPTEEAEASSFETIDAAIELEGEITMAKRKKRMDRRVQLGIRKDIRREIVTLRLDNRSMSKDEFKAYARETIVAEYQDVYFDGDEEAERFGVDWNAFLDFILRVLEEVLPIILRLI